MSPRPKKDPVEVVEEKPEVVEEKPLDQVHTEAEIAKVKEQADVEEQSLEEFNVHIQTLVRNFVQQEVAGLEERIRDLEVLRGQEFYHAVQTSDAPEVRQHPDNVPDYTVDVPEYNSAHQETGDGVPFYRAT